MVSFVRRQERRHRIFGAKRRNRRMECMFNYDEMPNDAVYERFRFQKRSILALLGEIAADITATPTRRNHPVPPLVQVLVCLRFLATGAFYNVIGDAMSLSKATVGRCIRRVVPSIARLATRYVKWPTAIDELKQKFHKIAGFPNVVGAVDGTFIKLCAPSENEPDYLNRKGFHSLNVQITCDASHRITSCVAKWPGSVHDSRIFKESSISRKFETGEYNGFLLGDSAYACKPFCLTPYLAPTTPTQINYNKSHCRTRVLIEQTFGILKRRFACLHYGLRVEPNFASQVTLACVVLHNFGITHGDILNVIDNPDDDNDIDQYDMDNITDNIDGRSMRNTLAANYF